MTRWLTLGIVALILATIWTTTDWGRTCVVHPWVKNIPFLCN